MKRRYNLFPILLKLILLITLLVASVGLLTSYKNSQLFEQISKEREENSNLNQANSKSMEVEGIIQSYVEKVKFFGLYFLGSVIRQQGEEESMQTSFQSDPDLLGLEILKKEGGSVTTLKVMVNKSILEKNKLDENYIEKLRKDISFPEQKIFSGEIKVVNASLKGGLPAIKIGIPLLKDGDNSFSHIAYAYVLLDRLQKAFSLVGEQSVFLVDETGKTVAHGNEEWAMAMKDLSKIPIVVDALGSLLRLKQKYFENPENNLRYLGAYAKTPFGLIVVAESPESTILAPSRIVREQSYFLLGIILSITFFFVYIFASSLTTPIKQLVFFTHEISKGHFDINAGEVIPSYDELGILAESFDEMALGLKEREKIKTMFSKFHGTSVTEEILENELNRGGKRKEVIIFFSDIRGFTDYSEHHTPEEVVAMLNSYFEVMVTLINHHKGVVDKFIGDAIMAVWGAPEASPKDSENCLMACLDMRKALVEFNDKRIRDGHEPIKIGMGIHTGTAISGTIGSEERMEYTVIGDTVNTTSRIEAATKAFGTDILISGEMKGRVGEAFLFELAGETQVKGKKEPLKLYKILGYRDQKGKEVIVETAYSKYKAEKADKVKVLEGGVSKE